MSVDTLLPLYFYIYIGLPPFHLHGQFNTAMPDILCQFSTVIIFCMHCKHFNKICIQISGVLSFNGLEYVDILNLTWKPILKKF